MPDWRWEAFEKDDERDGIYYGRVKSPNTYGNWEWGYFSQDQLEKAGAYRIGTDIGGDEELFPDGGYELSDVYETELAGLGQGEGEDGSTR